MTASFNISFLSSPEAAGSGRCKKGCRSYKLNNYLVQVVDFDSDVNTFEVEAVSASEASEQAADIAQALGIMVDYCNVYCVEQ